RIAFLARDRSWLFGGLGIDAGDLGAAQLRVGSLVPGDLESLTAFFGSPIAVRHHRNTRADLHDMAHALDGFSLWAVEASRLSAEHGAAVDGCAQPSRNFPGDAVDSAPR